MPSFLKLCALAGLFFGLAFPTFAQDLPRSSPRQVIEQRIGLTEVTITYGRPGVKGRKGKLWGKLVPYDKLWRTGANEATVISFSDSVLVNGFGVPAGEYALFTIPHKKDDWTILLNKNPEQWGTEAYDPSLNFLKFTAPAERAKFTETLTFEYANIRDRKADILLRWEKKQVRFHIEVFTLEKAKRNILAATKNATENGEWEVLLRSADFYLRHRIDLAQARVWVEKAIEINPEHYWAHWLRAELLALEADYNGAIRAAKTSLLQGTQEEGESFQYKALLEGLIQKWEIQLRLKR